MSIISKIDKWLIEVLYQGIVDLSQRKPAWWARQCVIGSLVLEALRAVLFQPYATSETYWFWTALFVMCLFVLWLITASPAIFAVMGAQAWVRAPLVAILLIRAVVMVFAPTPSGAFNMMMDVVFGSVYFFAACHPPRPRIPRSKLASAGGAA